MAMVPCRECRKDISTQATVCPHCGCPNPVPPKTERQNSQVGMIILGSLVAVVVLVATCNKAPPPPSPMIIGPVARVPPTPPLHPDVVKARAAVAKIKDEAFCAVLGKSMRNPKGNSLDYQAALIDRAEKREGMTPAMLAGVMGRRPVLGMNACAVIAALGSPDRANRSVRSGGEHYQLVYSDRRVYVYLDNNVVTSFQD